jgi:hypothetical protein
MWRVYQWVWHRAQKSAAKEIAAMALAHFEPPYEGFRGSRDPAEAKHYALRHYARREAEQFVGWILDEFEIEKKPKKLNLLSFRDKVNDQERQISDADRQ